MRVAWISWISCCLLVFLAGCGKGDGRADRLERRVAGLERLLRAPGPGRPPAVVEAEGFVLVGSDGKVKARLGFDRLGKLDHVPGLYLYDRNGTKRVAIVETGWGGGLGVYDGHGRTKVGISDRGLFRHRELNKSHPPDPDWPPPGDDAFHIKHIAYPQKPPPEDWLGERSPCN